MAMPPERFGTRSGATVHFRDFLLQHPTEEN